VRYLPTLPTLHCPCIIARSPQSILLSSSFNTSNHYSPTIKIVTNPVFRLQPQKPTRSPKSPLSTTSPSSAGRSSRTPWHSTSCTRASRSSPRTEIRSRAFSGRNCPLERWAVRVAMSCWICFMLCGAGLENGKEGREDRMASVCR